MPDFLCPFTNRAVDGQVTLPGSKSITNRALLLAALADGTTVLKNPLLADDTACMMENLRQMGIAISVDPTEPAVEITGTGGRFDEADRVLDCQNAGTVMRFLVAACCLGHGRWRLDGSARMRTRPIGGLVEALRQLGALIEFPMDDGCPPVVVHGRGLRGGRAEFLHPESSQWISAVMMASPLSYGDVFLEFPSDSPSRPYVALTSKVMTDFGVVPLADPAFSFLHGATALTGAHQAAKQRTQRVIIAAPERYSGRQYVVEPDASSASYFFALPALLGGALTVQGLGTLSAQGDVRFVDLLAQMGCSVEKSPDFIRVSLADDAVLRGIDVDMNDVPDVVQTLAVLALFADGPTTIRNVANLRIKETDRIAALATELRKFGAAATESTDGLTITPPSKPTPATVDTYDDHRMAMSFALAGLRVRGTVIRNAHVCSKSFPGFFESLERAVSGGRSMGRNGLG